MLNCLQFFTNDMVNEHDFFFNLQTFLVWDFWAMKEKYKSDSLNKSCLLAYILIEYWLFF